MKTVIVLEIEHEKPILNIGLLAAQRAYTLQGVSNTILKLQIDVAEPAKNYGNQEKAD